MTRFAGVPDTVVTAPLPSVVLRKSSDSALALMVSIGLTDAEIGWICLTDTADRTGFNRMKSVPSYSKSNGPEAL